MRAGKLRQRINIQIAAETRSAYGDVIESWETTAQRWGEIRPLRANELEEANRVEGRVTHKVILRNYVGLLPEMRFEHAGRVFNIKGILNPDERDISTEILCLEEPATYTSSTIDAVVFNDDGAIVLNDDGDQVTTPIPTNP